MLLSSLTRGRNAESNGWKARAWRLQLTEAELEALITAVRNTSNGRFAELEFKLRAAWRRALSRSDYRSVIPDVG